MKNSSSTKIIIGIIIGVLALITIIILSLPFHRYQGLFPIYWDKTFNSSIQYYIQTRPTRNVALITGARQSGKSTVLNQISEKLQNEGRFVVNVDALEVKTLDDLVKRIRAAVALGLTQAYNILSTNMITGLNEIQDPQNETSLPIPSFPNPALQKPFIAISSTLESIGNFSEMAVHKFFDTFEAYEELLRPVLIFQNIEYIYELDSRIIKSAVSRLSRRNHYNDYVPVFVEIKNSHNLINLETTSSFQVLTIKPIHDSRTKFVFTNPLFRRSEYRKIFNTFGSHQGTFARVFEDLRYNVPIEKSILNIKEEIKQTIQRIGISKVPSEICSKSEKVLLNFNETAQLAPLFANGYLVLNDGMYVKFMNKEVRTTLCTLPKN
ncbi:hypothetical protein GPJ56_007488 [Histomonas meleagridis]|uniref:uncharacterized protein n=1 Tax=Histomonas meleagridis TaxID=135588 RepID=UPI003559A45E|nr:hypothetical protein GPJ56_007488 [Histomonas meleagridis]KAH0804334.1 hypothetical protein GO595_003164 [Histomonas meleagridis]